MHSTIPEPLFIFEMANNHMGSADHGLHIIREFHELTHEFAFRFAFKLQYRNLDTFIHPEFKSRSDVKYVKRFMETRLADEELLALVNECRSCGFVTVCTPFDEESVDKIEAHGIEIIKIASCSFTDWPLLERIARSDKPIIASTAAVPLEDIDKVVSFFEHREKDLALMHCVAEYPTGHASLQLNQVSLLRTRYPRIRVGYSTHEAPDNTDGVKIAVAKGATLFEKHVGVPTDHWPLNGYSAAPEQALAWLRAARAAYEMCGTTDGRSSPSETEAASLLSLRRGVFAGRPIRKGEMIDGTSVFMAFPAQPAQVTANDWSKYSRRVALEDIPPGAALTADNTSATDTREQIYAIVQQVKQLLQDGHVVVPGEANLEISHHYGLENFDQFGMVMITVVNREYCKKLLVLLPGQTHPEQHHYKKEETFVVLHGDVAISLDGVERTCRPGDVLVVMRGVRHKFTSPGGCVLEEISSTHSSDDSFYTDPAIAANPNRKTFLTYWMR